LLVEAGLLFRDARTPVARDWGLVVAGGTVLADGPVSALRAAHPRARHAGGADCVVTPGFVDAHQHGRGQPYHERGVDDQPLEEWSGRFAGMRPVAPRTGVALAAAKLLAAGVTTTLHHHVHTGASDYWTELADTEEAYLEEGIRATIALDCHDAPAGVYDRCERVDGVRPLVATPPAAELAAFLEDRGGDTGGGDGLLSFALGLRGVNWCSDGLLREVAAVAVRLGAGVHLHVAETRRQRASSLALHGRSPVERLADAGLLDTPCSLAHCVWVSEHDVSRLAGTQATVVHNPASNLRLSSGVAPVLPLLRAGVPVAIGGDNLNLDEQAAYLGDLRLCRALHFMEGAALRAADVLEASWAGGASATFREGRVGRLEAGAAADLVVFRAPALVRRASDGLAWETDLAEALLRLPTAAIEAVVVAGWLRPAAALAARVRDLEAQAREETVLSAAQAADLECRRRAVDDALPRLLAEVDGFDRDPARPFYRYNGAEDGPAGTSGP
jgi:cytosine/adenosine deaminase-related metal-dependent hydrolase